MDWANILGKYMDRQPPGAGGAKPGFQQAGGTESVHRDFDEVVQKAPRSALAEGLAEAFRSNQTPPFGEMIAHLFSQANSEQRAGILSHLLSFAPSGVVGNLAGMFSKSRDVKPEDPNNMSTDTVRQVADEAARKDPNIIDQLSEFLAGHPGLVKNLDIGSLSNALGAIGQRLGGGRGMTGGGRA